jgi:choline-sulfatase
MPERPNILWIYCDELRTDALGCYGHPDLRLHTPHLDRIATLGLRFTNCFCNSPVCVSSRVSTLTGLYPEDTGVYNNEGAWPHFRLPRPLPTFPEAFAQSGYATANFGKVHLPREMRPFQHSNPEGGGMGFWQHLGEQAVRMIRAPHGGMNGGVFPDAHPYPPDAVARNALQWIEAAPQPWLVRLSFLQPHTPVLPPRAFADLYGDQMPARLPRVPEGVSRFQARIAQVHQLDRMDPELYRLACAHYYAQVAWVDSQVGRALECLESRGALERTVIAFTSDHGNPLGETGHFEKHTFAPSVHRVPFLLCRPGTLPEGLVRRDICEGLDLPRTLLEAAGLPCPDGFRGRSVLSDPAPRAVYATIGFGEPDSKMGPNGGRGEWYGGRGWPRRSCVRTALYRYDRNMRMDGAPVAPDEVDAFLADVQADPEEVRNLAHEARFTETVRSLDQLLARHAEGAVEVPGECLRRG